MDFERDIVPTVSSPNCTEPRISRFVRLARLIGHLNWNTSANIGRLAVTNLPQCAKSVRSLGALSCLRIGVRLFCELPQHEIRHDMAGLDGFRQGRIIPERMRKRVEDHEACINASAQIGAM